MWVSQLGIRGGMTLEPKFSFQSNWAYLQQKKHATVDLECNNEVHLTVARIGKLKLSELFADENALGCYGPYSGTQVRAVRVPLSIVTELQTHFSLSLWPVT